MAAPLSNPVRVSPARLAVLYTLSQDHGDPPSTFPEIQDNSKRRVHLGLAWNRSSPSRREPSAPEAEAQAEAPICACGSATPRLGPPGLGPGPRRPGPGLGPGHAGPRRRPREAWPGPGPGPRPGRASASASASAWASAWASGLSCFHRTRQNNLKTTVKQLQNN